MLSVVVATYNGAHKIETLLNALERQTVQDFELLVIIDGSVDNTAAILKQRHFMFKNFRIVEQENKGRAGVRNSGAKIATGNLLVFFDDDMEPLENCLAVHLSHHQLHPDSLLSGAAIDNAHLSVTAFQKYKVYLSEQWCKPLIKKQGEPLPLEEVYLTAANFSISKQHFLALGGFDEALNDAEDYDLAVRARLKGLSVYYDHKAFAWHNDFPSCRSFIKRQQEYRYFHKYLVSQKPSIYKNMEKLKTVEKNPFYKQAFFSFWKYEWWIKAIDKQWLAFLPQKVQYKVYDWIVTANAVYKSENERR